MEFSQKTFVKLIYLISRVFQAWNFFHLQPTVYFCLPRKKYITRVIRQMNFLICTITKLQDFSVSERCHHSGGIRKESSLFSDHILHMYILFMDYAYGGIWICLIVEQKHCVLLFTMYPHAHYFTLLQAFVQHVTLDF